MMKQRSGSEAQTLSVQAVKAIAVACLLPFVLSAPSVAVEFSDPPQSEQQTKPEGKKHAWRTSKDTRRSDYGIKRDIRKGGYAADVENRRQSAQQLQQERRGQFGAVRSMDSAQAKAWASDHHGAVMDARVNRKTGLRNYRDTKRSGTQNFKEARRAESQGFRGARRDQAQVAKKKKQDK